VSHAVRAIGGDVHLASTGTPVENRLLDLWNIMDILQPAVLGTAADFTSRFERALGTDNAPTALQSLRESLLYRQPHSYLMRRTKAEVLDLPTKKEIRLFCEITDKERAAHLDLISVLTAERRKGRHLSVLHRLAQLYQHSSLLGGDWEETSDEELIEGSTKLQVVMNQLRQIALRGEKAIIFARHLEVQRLLARVVGNTFGLRIDIINGNTSRGQDYHRSTAGTNRAVNERKRVLDRFRSEDGFGVVVLSPFVAGIGLTIVEANHVIHYGRWWNPAVENQATDRVYRIGQTRQVCVYLPIIRDGTKVIGDTFDECLDRLLTRKANLATDFLHPATDEGTNASELCDMLDTRGTANVKSEPLTAEEIDALTASDFEAAVAALYAAQGYKVVLTAAGGDGGADVIAVSKGKKLLIQTKHSARGHPVDERGLSDVIGALDIYGNHLGAGWKPAIPRRPPKIPHRWPPQSWYEAAAGPPRSRGGKLRPTIFHAIIAARRVAGSGRPATNGDNRN
jgi:HJR/Mrr/RecB family endonuclease